MWWQHPRCARHEGTPAGWSWTPACFGGSMAGLEIGGDCLSGGFMRVACACLALAVTVFAAVGWAQADRGQIRGTLSGARGPIANAEVRIKNAATGEVIVTTTSPAGEFSVTVPTGTYDVFSSTVGYAVLARAERGGQGRRHGAGGREARRQRERRHARRDLLPLRARGPEAADRSGAEDARRQARLERRVVSGPGPRARSAADAAVGRGAVQEACLCRPGKPSRSVGSRAAIPS